MRKISEDSEAYAKGVRRGDVLAFLDDMVVSSLESGEASRAIQKIETPFKLTFIRDRESSANILGSSSRTKFSSFDVYECEKTRHSFVSLIHRIIDPMD